MTVLGESVRVDANELAARYPQRRSALLPILHLLQSVQGYVSNDGIALAADVLDLTPAEVTAVATFYTMYYKKPVGQFHVGVCINPGCAMLGGDAVWERLTEHLGIDNHEVTTDGMISLERIECQAACTHAPVMTANWEFLDDVTPDSAVSLVDRLRRGEPVASTRGPSMIPSFMANERTLAGFADDLSDEGPNADDKMLAGLRRAKELGMRPLTAAEIAERKAAELVAMDDGQEVGQ